MVGILIFLTLVNGSDEGARFGPMQSRGLLESPALKEASGLVASRKNANVLWVHNDSGDDDCVYAIDLDGRHLGKLTLQDIRNRDWEDIAIGPGPDPHQDYLYIGDIGDNSAQHDQILIYRIPEPVFDTRAPQDIHITGVETLRLRYPDGPRDAEALLVDPQTGDLIIVSKRDEQARVYSAPYPESDAEPIELQHIAAVDITLVVAGDISRYGDELLLLTYSNLYYWCRGPGQTWQQALQAAPAIVTFSPHLVPGSSTVLPVDEAVCWAADGTGYYTTNEKILSIEATLSFYPRLPATNVPGAPSQNVSFVLDQNYPNPFNPSTQIEFKLKSLSQVSVKIFNLQGEPIKTLTNRTYPAGAHKITWDGTDQQGNPVPNGVYFYEMRAGDFYQVRRMSLSK